MGSLAPDRSILDRLMIDYYYYSLEYYHTKEKYEHFKRSKSVGDSWAMYRSMVSLSRMESRVDGFKRAIGLK